MLLPVVKLKTPRNSRHPWIYKKMTNPPRGLELEPGSLVEVRAKDNSFVGYAFYHPENTIALRLLSETKEDEIDAAFLLERLRYAKAFREDVLGLGSAGNCYRLVHAEADFLPGLVIDKFGDVLLIEPYVAGWLHLMDWLVEALSKLYPGCRPAVRADVRAEAKEGVSFSAPAQRYPPPASVEIVENSVRYRVDFATGHKTGFFLDQRDNRARIGTLAKNRRTLDLCCYSGGFALSALKGGAREVTAVDLDEKALAAARINASLNAAEKKIAFVHSDAFDYLRERIAAAERYDLIILDPPKLAGSQDDAEKALTRYRDLNRAALGAAAGGGLFLTCSCSGSVPEERWRRCVRQAAADAGRNLTIFLNAGPGPDHPVAGDFPQGQYLKAMFARVD